jgi:hypothetical protein
MLTLLTALGSLLSFRVRSRLTLELELAALRHQVTVLRRHRPGLHHRHRKRAARAPITEHHQPWPSSAHRCQGRIDF